MTNGRNSSGRFEKGHSGFKPKGSLSKKKNKREQLFNHVLDLLGESIAESIHTMPPKQVVKLYLQLLKLSVPKLARIPYIPDPPAPPPKVRFEFIDTAKTNSFNQTDKCNP